MKTKTENTTQNTPSESAAATSASARAITLEALMAENAELRAAIRMDNARSGLTRELAKAGARSPELLFDAAKDDLQFSDDGILANAAAIVERLTKGFPEQFGTDPQHVSIDGGAGRIAAPALTKDALAKMSPAEIARLDWAVVRQALTEK